MKKLFIFMLLSASALYFSSCYKDNLAKLAAESGANPTICDTAGTISYATEIVPILQANCSVNNSSCHSAGNNASGYNFSTYPAFGAEAANGDLINAITWTGSVPQMPLGEPQLSECNIAIIKKWVDQGHLNN